MKLSFFVFLVGWIAAIQSSVLPPSSINAAKEVEVAEQERPSIRLLPDESDKIFKTGVTFQIICEADFNLDWKLPSILETRDYGVVLKNELEDRISIEDIQLYDVEDESANRDGLFAYPYRSILTVSEASYTDTGYYACHNRDNDDGDDGIRTYIFVEDEDNLIVQHRQVMMFSQRLSRYSVIVPCKPSHPDIEMSVMIDKDTKADWVYDPHVGFYVDNDFLNSAANSNLPVYRCLARHPKGFEADNPVYIWQPFKPLIAMESDVLIQMPTRRLVVSSHFQLNCSTTFYQSQNLTVELFWMVPQLQGIDGRRVRSEKVVLNATPRGGKKRTTVRSSLRVVNATLDDSGLYMCASHQSSKETSTMEWAEVFVNIHHKEDESFLLVSTPYNDGPRDVEAGKTATFVVYVDARPDPAVDWYKDNEAEPIRPSSKYVVHRSWGKTYLKIRDATVADNGVYRLVATSGKQRKSVNFTLVVDEQRPQAMMMSWRYSFELVSPLFWINSQPPIVGFSFLQCRPPLPCQTFTRRSSENDETVWDVDTSRQIDRKGHIVLEPLTIYIKSVVEDSTNETGNEPERFFYLGWVVNTFYNTNGSGLWLWTQADGTTLPLDLSNPPSGFNISKRHCLDKRGYCYRIKGINTNSDQLGHSVVAGEVFTWTFHSSADGSRIAIPIQIQDAREPVIIKSSDSTVSVEQGKSTELFCLADGLPSPGYQWLLNGDPVPDEWIEPTADGVRLKILAADSSVNGGVYTCRFDNVAGTTEQSFNLQIL
ncbi:hemicentin-1-like isoform X2 [Daphnia pulex]|uniref:hemicentin-1-like isoform X2 n=1 Tax=Daphnia pulex TaxID=6669 RepID=UPI001EE0487B|nr:hemicentin-1-like isoform X2 [Daphnia pulex]XP_046463213.1 hemicentin-1-like isoform X2 [Daphnia pulex]